MSGLPLETSIPSASKLVDFDSDMKPSRKDSSLPTLSKDSFDHYYAQFNEKISQLSDYVQTADLGTVVLQGTEYSIQKLQTLPENENFLKCTSAACLALYGGSWTKLAGFIAAAEAFGTVDHWRKLINFVSAFMNGKDDEEDDITVQHVKDMAHQTCLHVGMLVAVLYAEFWAEVCICLAFANYLMPLVSIVQAYGMDENDKEEWFNLFEEEEWFELLCSLGCKLVALIVFGIFPNLATAVYMAMVGLKLAYNTASSVRFYIPLPHDTLELWQFETETELKGEHFCAVFATAMMSALWQCSYGYTGSLQILSNLVFVYPIVKTTNWMITGEWSSVEEKESKKNE